MKRYSIPAIALLLTASLQASAHYEEHSSKHVNHKAKSSKELGPSPTQFDPWDLLKKALSPAYAASNEVSIVIEGDYRIVKSNGLPDHETGAFPNRGNPNTIREQHYTFKMPTDPQATGRTTWLGMYPFGVAINGIPFDPGAAEWWDNDPYSGWQYEAMALGPRLGIDQNNAHVQPNGAYHYHGPPTGLIDELSHAPKPTLLGYAADGFPIYGPFGHSNPSDANSGMTKLHPSYRIKQGIRPNGPGGDYDGLFTQDYEYKKGLGQLDECNGRFGVTEEFPKGTYYYVITDSFPYIPRGFKGTPDPSFLRRGGSRLGPPPPGRRPMGPPGFGPPGGPGFQPPPGFGPPPDEQ